MDNGDSDDNDDSDDDDDDSDGDDDGYGDDECDCDDEGDGEEKALFLEASASIGHFRSHSLTALQYHLARS